MRCANSFGHDPQCGADCEHVGGVLFASEDRHLQLRDHRVAELVHCHEEYVADHELDAGLPLLRGQAPERRVVCRARQLGDAVLELGDPHSQLRGSGYGRKRDTWA
jgi:hypothetical protein